MKKDQDINFYLGNFPFHTEWYFNKTIAKVQYSLNFKICSDISYVPYQGAWLPLQKWWIEFQRLYQAAATAAENRLIVALEKIKIVYFGC